MDFIDPKKKKAHVRRLLVGYILMGIAIGLATLILVIITNGYRFDPKTGNVIQNGLVFVDAHPESATVYIDGKQRGQTAQKLDVPAGQHNLELRRSGYRSWQRQFTVEGGDIKQFIYPFLFPENMVVNDLQVFAAAPGMVTESPDRHWLVVQQTNSLTNFQEVDLNDKNNIARGITLPDGLFTTTGKDHLIEFVEWSSDNRHLLVKHTFDTETEFVLIDRDTPASSVNLNQLFNTTFTKVTLRDKSSTQFYLYNADGGVLIQADSKTKQTRDLLTHVVTYRSHGADIIFYITDQDSTKEVQAKLWDNGKTYTLRQLPVSTSGYLIDLARFNDKWFMVVGARTEQKAYIYRDPFDQLKHNQPVSPITVLKVQGAQHVSFSAIARFIAIQGGSKFAIYDAENNDQYHYDTKLPIDPSQTAFWMDGHRLVLISNKKVHIFDFDGTNMQTLSDANLPYQVFFDRDYNAMFTIAGSHQVSQKQALLRTDLKIKQ